MTETSYEERFAVHPNDVKGYNTDQLRTEFLIDKIFNEDKSHFIYSAYDRFIVGGVMPVNKVLSLDAIDPLKTVNFCDRREVGIINIGGEGSVNVDNITYELHDQEALYIGKGACSITFESKDARFPALFYINSTPAHQIFPTKKITLSEANILDLGNPEAANERQIIQYIVGATVSTNQLQMGMTKLKKGSVWNTMPPHTHNRRMEVYLYTNVPENHVVSHFMGKPQETRHIWLANNQAVISPPWSIHSGSGTSNYNFIWGMAGENLDFSDMDSIELAELR